MIGPQEFKDYWEILGTLEDAVSACISETASVQFWSVPDTQTCVCAIVLDNGFTLIGHAGSASTAKISSNILMRDAALDAVNQFGRFAAFRHLENKIRNLKKQQKEHVA
jgi:hypothetical protein